MEFAQRVRAFVRTVPAGRVTTYADVALAIGRPGAARAVGRVMARTEEPEVPCHRVVRADGAICPARGMAARLRREGVAVREGKVRDLASRRWP